jgi:hypothetical protein
VILARLNENTPAQSREGRREYQDGGPESSGGCELNWRNQGNRMFISSTRSSARVRVAPLKALM